MIWVSSLTATVPSDRGGIRAGQRPAPAVDSPIQPVVGSIPTIVTEPAPYGAWAAITRSPDVASARPRVSSPAMAGTSAADDDQPATEGDPAAHRGQLLGGEARGVDVLPDEAVQGRPRLEPRRQVLEA